MHAAFCLKCMILAHSLHKKVQWNS